MRRRAPGRLALAVTVLVTSGLATACTPAPPAEPSTGPTPAVTDYTDSANWLTRPAAAEHEVATFYLSPTTYFGDDAIAPIDDAGMRARAAEVFAVQGAAFASTDVYAPYYRQLSLDEILPVLDAPAEQQDAALGPPTLDALSAFDAFVAEELGDRPFILAAHSQGAMVMQRLIAEVAATDPALLDRLVAAYLVGAPLSPDYPAEIGLPFATGASDTGVLIAWNSESPNTTTSPFVTDPAGLVINPISWTRDETLAPSAQSLGGLVRFESGEPATPSPRFASAQLDLARGTVVTDAPLDARAPWPSGVLHRWDYDLFLYDVEQNVRDRIAAYLTTGR